MGKIGVDFALKVLNWDSSTTIRLQLWDIAGEILTNLIHIPKYFCRSREIWKYDESKN